MDFPGESTMELTMEFTIELPMELTMAFAKPWRWCHGDNRIGCGAAHESTVEVMPG